jgi:hypothetical protein
MMRAKWSVALVALFFGVVAAADSWAHGRSRSHITFGLHFGAPLYGWHYAPRPYYYYPYPGPYYPGPALIVQSPPPVYVQRYIEQPPPENVTGPQGPVQHYWYYCRESQIYFPYVKECPGGWQRVLPQAPQQ